MSDKQTAQVVVVRCADLLKPGGPSVVRQCATCGENCWASKSTADLESKYDVTYSCQVCTPPEIILQQHNVAIVGGQRAELEEQYGVWGATMMLGQLGITEVEE